MIELDALGVRSYVAEPARGRRKWSKEPEAQAPVYGNRRRIRGPRGRRLMRQRGERIERSLAHVYDMGGMRRTHLRGHNKHSEAPLDSCGGIQSRADHASVDRPRDAAGPAEPPWRHHRHGCGTRGSYPAPCRPDRLVAATDRDLARLGLSDHAPCQLVSGVDLYHGPLGHRRHERTFQ